MKYIRLSVLAAGISVALASCGGPGEGKKLSEISGATTADSLSYYYGEMYADNYWRMSANDSVALSESARRQYLKGVEKGLGIGADDKAYSEGLLTGLQFALGIKEIEKEMGVKLNRDVIMQAMACGLRSDTAVDINRTQMELQKILQRIGDARDRRNEAAASEALQSVAKKARMTLLCDGVYAKIKAPGEGVCLKDGDHVKVEMTMTTSDGRDVSIPLPTEIMVGNEFHGTPVSDALLKLKPGEDVKLAVSANSLFGSNVVRMNLEPEDVVYIQIKVGEILPHPEENFEV